MKYFSHIQSPLSEQDCNLFVKAISKKGSEANAFIWLQWYFDFKNNPNNVIPNKQQEIMIKAIEDNKVRILKEIKK